jgi:hypothetical protein
MKHIFSHKMKANIAIIGAVLWLLCSCTGGDSKPASPVKSSDVSQELSSAYCGGIAHCCKEQGIPSDTASCKQTLEAQFRTRIDDYLSSSKLTYDAEAAGACVADYRKAMESCTDRDALQNVDTNCERVFVGTVALGGKCEKTMECAPADKPNSSVDCDDGVCVAFTDEPSSEESARGKLGDPCRDTCQQDDDGSMSCFASFLGSGGSMTGDVYTCWIDDGLICGDKSTCIATPKLGQSCNGHCSEGAYCADQVCVAQIESGGECESYNNVCVSTSYCDWNTSACAPKKADGEECDEDDECAGGECFLAHCRVWSVATPARCAGVLFTD